MTIDAALMQKAARCYLAANLPDEACRCFEDSGDHDRAGRLHEDAGRWLPAADRYHVAGQWVAAARCFLKANRPATAADCLVRAGDLVEGAWVLAEHAHRFVQAEELLHRLSPDVAAADGAELVRSRCEAGTRHHSSGARRLAALLRRWYEKPRFDVRLIDWALAVTVALDRPDLAAQTHATAYHARVPGAARQWEKWALDTLGDASGIPADDDDIDLPIPAER